MSQILQSIDGNAVEIIEPKAKPTGNTSEMPPHADLKCGICAVLVIGGYIALFIAGGWIGQLQ